MKRIFTLSVILCSALAGLTQVDTTIKKTEEPDTIKVGGMIIIRRHDGGKEIIPEKKEKNSARRNYSKPSNISTNWLIFDIGFSNYNDKTDYSSQETQSFAPGSSEETMGINTWKSRNINIWFFMQKLNMIQHIVNLKYGLGLELNNYFYDDKRVRFSKNPTMITLDPDYENLHKNKLAADYITIPLMININFTPGHGRGFGISGGVSAGLRYSSRQKIKNDEKFKLHDDFSLSDWKISYVGEILLGPVKLYGSYAAESMWEKGLDQIPYTVGVRLANW